MSNWEMKMALAIFLAAAVLASAFAGYEYYLITSSRQKEPAPISGAILWHGNQELPEIALTFDDGPNPRNTPKILDILRDNDVKATFFVIGKLIEKNGGILRRAAAEGHSLGNHTFTHANGRITDLGKINRELEKTDRAVLEHSGIRSKYFRPPFGFENWRFLAEAERIDNTVVLWSMDVGDWNGQNTANAIAAKICRNAKNGSIILLHDGGASREAVIDSLPVIIKELKKKGYKFVTIDEMLSHL